MRKTYHSKQLVKGSKELFKNLPVLAKETGLIQRKSGKFSSEGFVLSLLKGVLTGKGSFNQLACSLWKTEARSLSRQALWERIDERAVCFTHRVLTRAIRARVSAELGKLESPFARILIEDSSGLKLPKENASDFPAHGNGHGKTAGIKVDLCFDLLTGEPLFCAPHAATASDRENGKALPEHIRPGDLVLRDMGYFTLREFKRIEESGARWSSRLPANVNAETKDGTPLETHLKNAPGNQLELTVFLGKEKKKARLIAFRSDEQTVNSRRRKRRAQTRQQGRQPKKTTLQREAWHILVTNITTEEMETSKLFELYRLRWKIEIVFRAWKQSGHQTRALARKSNPFHLQCLLLASMLWLVLTLRLEALLKKTIPRISIEKLAHNLADFFLSLPCLRKIHLYNPAPSHLQMDKRTRQNLENIAFSCLT